MIKSVTLIHSAHKSFIPKATDRLLQIAATGSSSKGGTDDIVKGMTEMALLILIKTVVSYECSFFQFEALNGP